MKKLLSFTLVVILLFSLAGCTTTTSETTTSETTTAPAETTASEAATTSNESETVQSSEQADNGLKIAIVTSPSGVDDGSFNEDNYNGILDFIAENNQAEVSAVNEPTGDPAAAVDTVAAIVADYDVIVACGFQFSGIGAIALDNPDTKFILVDTFPVDADGNQLELDNVYAMQFAEQESGFFAGMAAALQSQTKKVAVVNGIAFPSNVNYQWGFESGVNYANKKYDTGVTIVELPSYAGTDVTGADVGGNYVGNFSDEATGKVVANALLDEGCDIIFVAAGASGNGVFTAVKEAGNSFVIGCDVDQFDDGVNGDANIILTSALKIMRMNVTKQLNNILDGSFAGQNEILTAASDSTGYVDLNGRQQLSADTLEKLSAAYALLKEGKIVPAANFNDITPEDFPGLND
ncbi:MAG: BMP family ABC transporter substrate-binding protein [Clostridiales bacterium]|nr:MAG: BMP family ABC transporter substrate-binding protein [Clostridiales bacterium]